MTPFTPHQIHSFCNIVEESHPVMPYQSSNKKTKKTCNRFISSQSKSHQSQSKSPPKSPLTKLLRSYDNPSNYSLSLSQTHQSHAMSTFTSKELIFLRRSNETLTIASSAQKTTISTLENSVSSLSMQVTSSLQSNRDLSKLCTQHNQDKANLQLANDQLQESLSETKTTLQKLSTKYSQDTTQIKKSTKIMLESAIAEKNAAQLKIRDLEHKVVEVESFLKSGNGKLTTKLEKSLCETRLQLALVQAEKDELEMDSIQQKRKTKRSKENINRSPLSPIHNKKTS